MSEYRNLIEQADAARNTLRQRQSEEAEEARQRMVQARTNGLSWFESVFLKEFEAANEDIRPLQASFDFIGNHDVQHLIRREFIFKRYANRSRPYILTIDGARFSFFQHAPVRHGTIAAGWQVIQDSEVSSFTNQVIGNDDAILPNVFKAIIQANVK